MINEVLLYIGSALTVIWGITHLFPTKSVVAGFGDIESDNKRIITMEWIGEGETLIFIGVLVAGVTLIDFESAAAKVVYAISALALIVMAMVSIFTGFRINFLPFRLCPLIFGLSAGLFLVGAFI